MTNEEITALTRFALRLSAEMDAHPELAARFEKWAKMTAELMAEVYKP